MGFPKQIKDIVYNLLQEPTLNNFRDFLKGHTGEHNTIDFKKEWIDKAKLVKEMLAIANSGGGILVFGVNENEDNTFSYEGLSELRDKAEISNDIKKYISSYLKYEVYDFVYNDSEYDKLKDNKYQMLVIEDVPEHLPFMALKETEGLKNSEIYIRRGTSCEAANAEEIDGIIKRRLNYTYPNSGEPLKLDEHLSQLKILYDNIDKVKTHYTGGIAGTLSSILKKSMISLTSQVVEEDNPLYPEESFEEFVARMIVNKKNKIERVLDLK